MSEFGSQEVVKCRGRDFGSHAAVELLPGTS